MEAQVSRVGESEDSLRPSPKVEIAAAEVARVAELANYQKGSVVSRILVRRDKGNVTLFAFDEGQELSEQTLRSMRWFTCWREGQRYGLRVSRSV